MSDFNTSLLVDQAYDAIKEDVLHKLLIPGKKINVLELSKRYNISVTPIKLALNRLVTEGMVESIPRRGMVVKPVTQETLREAFEIRTMIELFCVPQVLKKAREDPSYLAELENNIREHLTAVDETSKGSSHLRQNQIDSDFHLLLVSATQNERMLSIYKSLGFHMTMFYLYGEKRTQRFVECNQEHLDILNAVKAQDRQALEKAISAHLANTYKNYSDSLNTIILKCSTTSAAESSARANVFD